MVKEPVFTERIVTEQDLALWVSSKDVFLEELAQEYIGKPPMSEQLANELLEFLCVFSLGCSQLGLPELAEVYNKRVSLFLVGFSKMGYSTGTYMFYTAMRKCYGTFQRVVRKLGGRIDYLTFYGNKFKKVD